MTKPSRAPVMRGSSRAAESGAVARSTRRRVVSRLPRARREADIVGVTRALLKERGYENVLVAEIAERAGVVEGTIYRYFENKRDLLVKVAEIWFEELLAEADPRASVRGVRNRLRHVIGRNLSIIRQEPSLSRFILMDLRLDPAYRSTRLAELNRRFTHSIVEVLREGVDSGELASDVSIPLLRDIAFGAIEHVTWAFLRGDGDFSVDEAADGITDVIFRGMATEHRSSGRELDSIVSRLETAIERLKAST